MYILSRPINHIKDIDIKTDVNSGISVNFSPNGDILNRTDKPILWSAENLFYMVF